MKNPNRGGDWPVAILLMAALALVGPVLSKGKAPAQQPFLTLRTGGVKQVFQKPSTEVTQEITVKGNGGTVQARSDSCIFVTIHEGSVSTSHWPGSTVNLRPGLTKIHLTEVHDAGTVPYEARLGRSYNVAITVQ